MNNEYENKRFILEERTAKFGESVIRFCKEIDLDFVTRPLISQLVRSSTSVGANYMEANSGSSRKDFRNKIYICKKESQETEHWLRMVATATPEKKTQCQDLWREAHELTLIFGKIISTLNKSKLNQNSKIETNN